MSDAKIIALQDLIDTPKNLNKLQIYERKLFDASITLLFNCRNLLIHAESSSKTSPSIHRLVLQLKLRVDGLIDQARYLNIRIRPGTSNKIKQTILNNAILYNLIIFSRSWDLKIDITEIDELIIFNEEEKITKNAKDILNNIQTIDKLLANKKNLTTNIQDSDELAQNLIISFNKELELAEQAGALKGIIKLEKPKLLGKSKFYDQLGNIVLKIIMSFELEEASDPIAVRAIYRRLSEDFPRVKADMKDLLKVIEDLSTNGLIISKTDREGLQWIQLHPSETETNVILRLAKEKGSITIEELIMMTNWSLEEASREMDKFVQAGVAIKDASYAEGIKYYFPGLSE